MASNFSAADLRRLADALDAMAEMSTKTGVTITAIRVQWREAEDDQLGHYLAEWPED